MKGYVIVEVSGYALDRFVNLVAMNGIQMEQVHRDSDKIYMQLTPKDFKKLKPYAKKTKCRFRIVKKEGMPFVGFRYRRRTLFGIGSVLFMFALYTLCSFVWLVDITGAQQLEESEIMTYLNQTGYTTGKLKKQLNLRELEQELMRAYPEIVWISADYEGTKLQIQISEAVPKPEMVDVTKPCHIRAKKDALITYIATQKGLPQVKAGDIVRKGELIVSGSAVLEDEQQSLYLTHAQATIKAHTCYSIKASMPLQKTEKKYTDQVNKKYSLKIFNYTLPLFLGKQTFDYADTLVTIKQVKLTEQLPLPIYLKKEETVAYTPYDVPYEEQEIQEKLLTKAHEKLRETIGEEATVVKQEIIYTQDDDRMYAVYHVIVEEDIVEREYITEETIINPQTEREGVNE